MLVTHLAEEIIAEVIRDLKLGSDPAASGPWPVFVGTGPGEPFEMIEITNTAIPTTGRIQKTGETQGVESFQIRVYGKLWSIARTRILLIQGAFDNLLRYDIAVEDKSYLVQAIHRTSSSPIYMGPDPNNRLSFVLNCVTSITEG